MEVQGNRVQERAAVNAARTLFESCKYVFQEVELGNDYGKDVYVDLTEKGKLTGLCIALQIKGGVSYRRPGGYGIPLDDEHAAFWRKSSLPMAGLVFDPDLGKLHWCNISEFLHGFRGPLPSYIPVDAVNVLDAATLEDKFRQSFASFDTKRVVGPALLQLSDPDPSLQSRALRDCFILGRVEGRMLVLIRHLLHLFTGDVLRLAVTILAHATPHPDIMWTPANWIPQTACDEFERQVNWSVDEIMLLMKSAEWGEWHRGGYGQNVYSLLCVDPKIKKKMSDAAVRAMELGDEELAFGAMYLVIYWARDKGRETYEGFCRLDHRFATLPFSAELQLALGEQVRVCLFE